MKNKMKNAFLIGGAIIVSTLSSQAALVYTSGFDTTYLGANQAYVLGGATPDVAATDWFGATQGLTFGPSDLTLNYAVANRYRGSGVWLDTTGWAAGTVTVGVEVSGYTAGDGSSILFQTFRANGVDASNSVSLDLHGGPGSAGDPQVVAGTATIALFGTEQSISGSATQDFTFTYNGTDQFIALVFALENGNPVTTFEAATLDNLTVNTIPEPSSAALLGLAGLALILRRRN